MAIKTFRDLRVWRAAMEIAEEVYRVTAGFPPREIYGLASQMRRAAVSVPSNIAEGHNRRGPREYLHHISIAHGSLGELETQLELACRLDYVSTVEQSALLERIVALGKQLTALERSLRNPGAQIPAPSL